MEMLYKYYSNQSIHAFENIKNGVISFTPLVTLNDPLEGLGTYNYILLKTHNAFGIVLVLMLQNYWKKIFQEEHGIC